MHTQPSASFYPPSYRDLQEDAAGFQDLILGPTFPAEAADGASLPTGTGTGAGWAPAVPFPSPAGSGRGKPSPAPLRPGEGVQGGVGTGRWFPRGRPARPPAPPPRRRWGEPRLVLSFPPHP